MRIVAYIAAVASTAFGQGVIELKSSARIAPGAPIVLRDVALLQGPDAAAVSETPITPSASGVGIEDVRQALEGKVNWGRLSLRGSTCALQLTPAPRQPEPATPPASAEPAIVRPGTVREAVQTRLAQVLSTEPADLKLAFESGDAQFLDTPTAGRIVDVRTTAMADRIPLTVTLYEADRVIREKAIRVGVLIRRQVHIASVPRRRGETMESGDYRAEWQWLAPTIRPATIEQIQGTAARGRINPGDLIQVDDVAAAMVVGKGDVVAVRCISGGVIVSTKARAMGPARDGDVVEFQALDSKRRFFARMEGRGRAIVAAAPVEGSSEVTR